jgi:uncharacterized YigZ family protein
MLTIKDNKATEYEIKKSKFLSFAFKISSPEQAMQYISNIRQQHEKATHVCYAYILNENTEKYEDDGEPNFTAGKPILEVIKKQKLNYVLVVVVRYFGGVKLGAGGLVRAYGKSAASVLQLTQTQEILKCSVYKCALSYDNYSDFLNKLNQEQGVYVRNVEYLENVITTFAVIKEKEETCLQFLQHSFNTTNVTYVGEEQIEKTKEQ